MMIGADKCGVRWVAAWSAVLVLMLGVLLYVGHQETLQNALTAARNASRMVMAFRAWNARIGGVYAPTDKIAPNPYLTLPQRDVVTTEGTALTLVNPAYMTRLVFDAISRQTDPPIAGKLISLKPLNPANEAKGWEKMVLESFERGQSEGSRIASSDNGPVFTLVSRLLVAPECLTCHGFQGYKLGDVRGGISLSVPMAGYFASEAGSRNRLLLLFAVLWLAGSVVILAFSRNRCRQGVLLREQAQGLELLNFAIDHSSDAIFLIDDQARIQYGNAEAARSLGVSREELLTMTVADIDPDFPLERWPEHWRKRLEDGTSSFESRHRRRDGEIFPVEIKASIFDFKGKSYNLSLARNVTARKQAEVERSKLELQLLQAQKMESIGRLAGGVAHDFNNMLGVILGHADLAILKAAAAQPLTGHLDEIRRAAERSTNLTRQLLAFARKQPVTPQAIDLNETVTGMLKMLRRLIGEDIQLDWQPSAELWPVRMDPSQIDQILANLCANARDAICGIGRVSIAAGNCTLDAAGCAVNAEAIPGDYVLLVFSDTGQGIDREALPHIFEPFFTTKELGKGTGLGLATVYGIVRQSGGFIQVESAPEQGTRFSLYLPRHHGKKRPATQEVLAAAELRGTETVLLVEDEPAILTMAAAALEEHGYTVLTAATPEEALQQAGRQAGTIDLLLTDVVMPEMNGKELAGKIKSLIPGIRCLYMSGYPADIIARHGVLETGIHFLPKPLVLGDMLAKIRRLLNSRTP